jgi:excisionase family DNA binding protein
LTLQQASAYLGISSWTLRELIWRGQLPAIRITRKVHLDLRDLDSFIERSKERG